MGWGDEIMVTAQAKELQRHDPRKVEVRDRHGKRRWHEMWEGNPRIVRPDERGDFQQLTNGSGCRPYIDYARTNPKKWAFRKFVCEPGELYGIKPDARGYGRVIIDSSIKVAASPNKQWHGWQQLVNAYPTIPWAQVGPGARLRGVAHIHTATFQQACGVLMAARSAVLHEGGLHHAAAAVGTPAVVIYGGFTSPAQTGYALHRNIFTGGEPCGMRTACKHCTMAMDAITPAMVMAELQEILNERKHAA